MESHGVPTTLYTLFLPLNTNGDRRMQREQLHWVQSEILRYAGGLTRYPSSNGAWGDRAARAYRDLVSPIQSAAPLGPEAEAWFVSLAAKVALELEQQQILSLAQPVWLLQTPPHTEPVVLVEAPHESYAVDRART